jgi:hypothetical protein
MSALETPRCGGIVGQVKAPHFHALLLQPFHIGGEAHQRGVHLRPANARRTAHRGIKYFEFLHGSIAFTPHGLAKIAGGL